MDQTPERSATPAITVRILWTLLLVAISIAGSGVVLPGIDREAVDSLHHMASRITDVSVMSVVALGLTPFITAAYLVEILALLIPRWRALRYGGQATRQRLHRAALGLTILIASLQSYFISVWLRSSADAEYSWLPPIWPSPGPLQVALLVLTLTAGVFALLGLARGIERLGIGNGIALLIAGGLLWTWGQRLKHLPESEYVAAADLPTPIAIVLAALLIVATALVTWLITRQRTAAGRLPLCGLTPLSMVSSLVWFATPLAWFNLALPPWLRTMPGAAQAALVFTLATLLSLLLFREERLPWREPRGRTDAWTGTAISVGYLLGLLVAQQLLAALVGLSAVDVLAIAVVTAIVADLMDEVRFRRAYGALHNVWVSHSVAAADAAVAALGSAGIPALARGVCHRSLWRFFGPHLELVVLVPLSQAAAAQSVIDEGVEKLFASAALPTKLNVPQRPPLSPTARRALWIVPLLLMLSAGAGLAWNYAPTARIVLAAELSPGLSSSDREAALAQDVEVIKQRLHALKVWPIWVHIVEDHIDIWLPQRTPGELSTLLQLLTTNARLEFKLAEIGGEYLPQLATWAMQQQAQYPGLQVEAADFSRPNDGVRIVDRYVSAPDRTVLLRFLGALPPALQPAADRELVLERVQPRFDDDPAPRYRTHLLHRAATLSGHDIENAELTVEPNSGRYSVSLTFSADAGQRFGDFTAAHVGQRLAIVLNGEVTSAPVIQSPIRGGRAQISLGGSSSPAEQHDEGQSLATLLRGGALNTPLHVISPR